MKEHEVDNLVEFLVEAGKLKKMTRKGWVLRGIKNPETIAAHTFRMALLSWILGKERDLDVKKVIKIAMIHDLCEVYAGDITPYDKILPKDKKKRKETLEKWPKFLKSEEVKRFLEKEEKEWKALNKLTAMLPEKRAKEMVNLWLDFKNGFTREGRFVKQVDKVENLLQALEYREQDKSFSVKSWWVQIKEVIDDPLLLKLVEALEKKFYKKKK